MLYFATNSLGQRLSLVGSVITLYDSDGRKLRQWFYDSKDEAKKVFMSVV